MSELNNHRKRLGLSIRDFTELLGYATTSATMDVLYYHSHGKRNTAGVKERYAIALALVENIDIDAIPKNAVIKLPSAPEGTSPKRSMLTDRNTAWVDEHQYRGCSMLTDCLTYAEALGWYTWICTECPKFVPQSERTGNKLKNKVLFFT